MGVHENLKLMKTLRQMKTLDYAWNSQDWETFEKRHANHVEVFWPGSQSRQEGVSRIKKKRLPSSRYFLTTMSRTIRIKCSSARVTGLALWQTSLAHSKVA